MSTHTVEPNQTQAMVFPASVAEYEARRLIKADELNVGIVFAVETSSDSGDWESDPARRSPFFGLTFGPYAAGFDSFAPFARMNLTQYSVPLFIPLPTLVRPNKTLNTTMIIDSPYFVDGPELPPDYYQAVVRVAAAGVNMTTAMNPLSIGGQSWLVYPLSALLRINADVVSVSFPELVNVNAQTVHTLASNFTCDEWTIIITPSLLMLQSTMTPSENGTDNLTSGSFSSEASSFSFHSSNCSSFNIPSAVPPQNGTSGTVIYLGAYTLTINCTTADEAALVVYFVHEHMDFISAASTDGIIRLGTSYPNSINTKLLEDVSKIVFDPLDAVILRRFAVLNTPPPMVGGWSHPKAIRGALISGLAIAMTLLIACFIIGGDIVL